MITTVACMKLRERVISHNNNDSSQHASRWKEGSSAARCDGVHAVAR